MIKIIILLIGILLLMIFNLDITDRHIHPAQLPTDDSTWFACCRENDCVEAQIRVRFYSAKTADVTINRFKSFETDANKIHMSTNGHSYFCRPNTKSPPSANNIRCIFIADEAYN